jgi:hypothetical protein
LHLPSSVGALTKSGCQQMLMHTPTTDLATKSVLHNLAWSRGCAVGFHLATRLA